MMKPITRGYLRGGGSLRDQPTPVYGGPVELPKSHGGRATPRGRPRAVLGPLAVKEKSKEMKSSTTLDAAADRGAGGARSARGPPENWPVVGVSHIRNYYRC